MNNVEILYTWAGFDDIFSKRVGALKPGDVAVMVSAESGPYPISAHLQRHCDAVRAQGATPLGYVRLDYGKRPIGEVFDDLQAWHEYYGIARPFYDEWHNRHGAKPLGVMWGGARAYARVTTEDPVNVMMNPGVPFASQLPFPPGNGLVAVVHEEATLPQHRDPPESWQCAIVHSCTDPHAVREVLRLRGWQWCYATTGVLPNPYSDPWWDE